MSFNNSFSFTNYIATVGSTIANGIGQGAEAIYQGARTVEGHWDQFNTKVQNWTDRTMPRPAAKISQAFIHALPLLALTATSIATGSIWPAVLGTSVVLAYTLIAHARDEHTNGSKMMCNSNGFMSAYVTTRLLTTGIATGNPAAIVYGLYFALFATANFSSSGLIRDLNATAPSSN